MRKYNFFGGSDAVKIVAGLFLTSFCINAVCLADNAWLTPASGSWGTAGNWSEGLPQNSHSIAITAAGTYTVTVDDITADTALGMEVAGITVGASSGLPELAVGFTNTAQTLTVGAGDDGKIGVGITAGKQGRLSVASGKVSAARLHLGSGLGGTGSAYLAGGSVSLRSMSTTPVGTEWLRLGVDSGSVATLVMTGGQISGPSVYGGSYGQIGVAGTGLLIISNGLFRTGGYGIQFGSGAGRGELKLYGGTLYHGNDDIMKFPNIEVGSGVNSEGFILIDGGTLVVTNGANFLLGVRSGSRGILTISNGVFNTAGGKFALGSWTGGYGELNVVGGTSICHTPKIGSGTVALGGGRGVVNVSAEGYLTSVGGYTQLALGPGSFGQVNVSDNGRCEIGGSGMLMGDGDGGFGEINVTGGEFHVTGSAFIRSGTVNVNGGSFQTGILSLGTTGGTGLIKTGTVSIVSGTATFGNTTVGVSGRPGYLRVTGSGPSSIIANALTATTSDSTLQFTLDKTGVTPISVTTTLTLSADARLQIDFGNYDVQNGLVVPLIQYKTCTGAFDESNIEMINVRKAITVRVEHGIGSNDRVTLQITLPPSGTCILIR